MTPDLSVEFAGIRFANPIIVASATPTKDAGAVKKALKAGFAGVVVKSLFGNSAATGRRYPKPRFKLYGWREYPGYPEKSTRYFTLHSLEDWSTFDYGEYVEDIDQAKRAAGEQGIVIASISGSSFNEWEELCNVINGSRADMCEINVSCPFAADMGLEMGAKAATLTPEIVRVVKNTLSMPFSVKLSPQVPSLGEVAKAVEAAGANALTVQARLSGIMIDLETSGPMGWGSIGGYGGPYLLGYGLKGVSEVAREVEIPISGVSGIWDWEDVVRYIMVGATTVQSATAVMIQGYSIVRRWLRMMTDWMNKKGFDAIQDFKGSALKNIKNTRDVERDQQDVKVLIEDEKCNGCGACLVSCFYDAITMRDGVALIDSGSCDVCGLCVEKCPTGAASVSRIT